MAQMKKVSDAKANGENPDFGFKTDEGKLRFDLIPLDSLSELAEVYNYGDSKYPKNNWRKGMSWMRVFAAALRHLFAWARGEEIDPESGCTHLGHACWGIITLMNYARSYRKGDDRVKDMGLAPGEDPYQFEVKERKVEQKPTKKDTSKRGKRKSKVTRKKSNRSGHKE